MDKVALRALKYGDLPALLAWRNDPEKRRFFREYRLLTMEQHRHWYEGLHADRTTLMLGISYDGDLVGVCGLTSIDWIARSAEISLYIGDGYIDDVIAPAALEQLIAYGFQDLSLNRLWAEIWGFDAQKESLFTQFKFEQEVVRRQAHWCDGWHDALIYGKLQRS